MKLSTLAGQFGVSSNALYKIRDQFLDTGRPFIDLVAGNVTAQGIEFPSSLLAKAFAASLKKSKVYKPDPLGNIAARKAVSRYYAGERFSVPPEHIVLTPGTSVSYWYVFKLLADPGDEILVPTPSYPLFNAIADLGSVKLVPYRLLEGPRWTIDFENLTSHISPRTKAIVLISPHNPTGAVATRDEVAALADIAIRHNLAIIADEVFSPFVYTGEHFARPAETEAPLIFTLNGFSKMLALPGFKIGWIGITGDSALVGKVMKALEMISDTFLPVQEAAQAAVPTLLLNSQAFQKAYVKEMKTRRDLASKILGTTPPEGGFLMTIPLNDSIDEEMFTCELLKKERILVHPGFFYDIEGKHIVMSFAHRPKTLLSVLPKIKALL